MPEEKAERGAYGWLIIAGVLLVILGIARLLGIEWGAASMIAVGAVLIIWGVLVAKRVPGFEKKE